MKKELKILFTFLLAAGVYGSMYSQGKRMKSNCNNLYDVTSVEVFEGIIVKIESIDKAKCNSNGVHLKVKTDLETISVHLGPEWFLSKQDQKLSDGDEVTISGSRINYFGEPAIIASEVQKEKEVLVLRDDNGYPVWRGWRRKD